MISLFTTMKDLHGHNGLIQTNALRNWRAADPELEILVYGRCAGLTPLARELQITHVEDVAVSAKGVPLIGAMFGHASRRARYEACCFLNADILLPPAFFNAARALHAELGREYLLVGQRDDVDVQRPLSFKPGWETAFRREFAASMREHEPAGSDYFVFPRGQYQEGAFPELLVGRPGWDLWMIYNARRSNYRTIDLSRAVKVLHQNHDYAHNPRHTVDLSRNDEAQTNLASLPRSGWHLFTLLACNYLYRDGKLIENRARGDLRHWLKVQAALGGEIRLADRLHAWLGGWLRPRSNGERTSGAAHVRAA